MKSFLRKYATPKQLAILSEHGDAEKYLTDDWREASLIMPITSIGVTARHRATLTPSFGPDGP